jgi:hypothetical protein
MLEQIMNTEARVVKIVLAFVAPCDLSASGELLCEIGVLPG